MKTLVTGGSGFIGTHVVEKLCRRGDKVICISKDDLNTSEISQLDIEIIKADLNNGSDWKRILGDIDIVYHIAGITHARNYEEYYYGNYVTTKHLLQNCSRYCTNLKRFVYLSSLTAIGPSLKNEPVDEMESYHPVSEYGKSKMLGEQEVLKYRNEMPITILRPSAVYGPRERDMYMYMKSIKRGIQLLIGFSEKHLNLIYVEDLAEGIISAALNRRAEGEIYFLGSEVSYPNEEIGETMARIINRKIINIHLPHPLVFGICGLEELAGKFLRKEVFLNLQKARELVQSNWTCSIEKAKQQLGFSPSISLYEGFLRTFKWYRKMGWL